MEYGYIGGLFSYCSRNLSNRRHRDCRRHLLVRVRTLDCVEWMDLKRRKREKQIFEINEKKTTEEKWKSRKKAQWIVIITELNLDSALLLFDGLNTSEFQDEPKVWDVDTQRVKRWIKKYSNSSYLSPWNCVDSAESAECVKRSEYARFFLYAPWASLGAMMTTLSSDWRNLKSRKSSLKVVLSVRSVEQE